MHGNKIVQYLQNYIRNEVSQDHSRKLLYSSTRYTYMETTKTTCLFFKDRWIQIDITSTIFCEKLQNWLFRKPTEVSKNMPTFISIRPPITKWKRCSFWWLFFRNKNCSHFEFSINQIFGQRFTILQKVRYKSQLSTVRRKCYFLIFTFFLFYKFKMTIFL